MLNFIAKNPKQLNLCLRLMYAENVKFIVGIQENEKRKIEYIISVNVASTEFEILREKYRILIS